MESFLFDDQSTMEKNVKEVEIYHTLATKCREDPHASSCSRRAASGFLGQQVSSVGSIVLS